MLTVFQIKSPYDAPKTTEFLEAIPLLPVETLRVHLTNQHFEQWLTKVLYDKVLAKQARKIANRKLGGDLIRLSHQKKI